LVKNRSPVPGYGDFAVERSAKIFCATAFIGGARHGFADVEGTRGLLGCGTSAPSGTGRFMPVFDDSEILVTPSFVMSTWSASRRIQGFSGESRITIIIPGVPAHAISNSFLEAHAPQTKLS